MLAPREPLFIRYEKWQLDMGVPGLLEPLAGNRAKAGVRENLSNPKTLLETDRVTLQDGRSFALWSHQSLNNRNTHTSSPIQSTQWQLSKYWR
jgi:hypothetical protein